MMTATTTSQTIYRVEYATGGGLKYRTVATKGDVAKARKAIRAQGSLVRLTGHVYKGVMVRHTDGTIEYTDLTRCTL